MIVILKPISMFPKRNFAINKYIVMDRDNDINIINRYGKLLSF